jgi:itaconate CoA-transferase
MTVPLLHHDYAGRAPTRVGLRHPSIAPYGAFVAGDGVTLVLSIQNQREWQNFCSIVLQRTAVADDPRFTTNSLRYTNREDLEKIINKLFTSLSSEEIIERFESAGTAWGRLNDVAGLSKHGQLRRVEAASPSGPVALPAAPVRLAGIARPTRPIPALGEHSALIRKEFS